MDGVEYGLTILHLSGRKQYVLGALSTHGSLHNSHYSRPHTAEVLRLESPRGHHLQETG